MPRMNLRSIPLPSDPREDELAEAARAGGYALHIDGNARRNRQPHLKLFRYGGDREKAVAAFRSGAEGLRWLESEAAEAEAWRSREASA